MKSLLCASLVTSLIAIAGCASDTTAPEDTRQTITAFAGAPLFEGMGDHQHPITTTSNMAQRYFNQGLVINFAFNHAEAARSFRAAQKLDARAPMPYWGEALALGPNINVTSNGKAVMADADRISAFAAITQAQSLASNGTERERDYIAALATRYNGDPQTSREPLDLAYMNAMRALHRKYPNDDDAAALFAEAVMNTMPWDYWLDGDNPKLLAAEAIDVLETVLARSPRHPMALHLYIHAVEASSRPERAEAAADTLLTLVPKAGHLVHMPAHIYWRVGRYNDASAANILAAQVDEEYIAACNAQGFYPAAYYPHNIHFLWAASSMEGRSELAIASARKVADNVAVEMVETYPSIEFFKTIPLLSLTQFGRWSDVLAEPAPPAQFEFSTAIWHYARATAFARTGDVDAARAEYEQLVPLRTTSDVEFLDTLQYPATMLLEIADNLVAGEIAMVDGDLAFAISRFEQAVKVQDALPYTEPPFWYYPTRHTLGRALLENGDAAAAETVYRRDLELYPRNGWAMFGLMQSLEAQGKDTTDIKARFDVAWREADIVLTGSTL
ncbi:MAG: tetratricopeptide repeat protein [Pseudomonadota bacterium]